MVGKKIQRHDSSAQIVKEWFGEHEAPQGPDLNPNENV